VRFARDPNCLLNHVRRRLEPAPHRCYLSF
jgi:hypothetical protein